MAKAYEKILAEELILRDKLALDRTILAHERTFLSYIRTTLAVLVVGFTLLHLIADPIGISGGILLILAGVAILVIGIVRTLSMSRSIREKR